MFRTFSRVKDTMKRSHQTVPNPGGEEDSYPGNRETETAAATSSGSGGHLTPSQVLQNSIITLKKTQCQTEDLFHSTGEVFEIKPRNIMSQLRFPSFFVSFAEESSFYNKVACILVRQYDKCLNVALACCTHPNKAEAMIIRPLPDCEKVWIPSLLPEYYLYTTFTYKILGVLRPVIDYDHSFVDSDDAKPEKYDLTSDILLYNSVLQDLQDVGPLIPDRYHNCALLDELECVGGGSLAFKKSECSRNC